MIYRPGQTDKPNPNSRVYWVLSRRSTRQNVFTLPAEVADSKKKALLRVQVRRWAPFANVGFAAHWAGNRACVYAWNDDEVRAAIQDAGLSERRAIVYPETFLRQPLQDGVRLVAAFEGYEGQVWREGFVVYTRWWPNTPGRQEWEMFVRSAGLPLDEHRFAPEPTPAEFLDAPWTRQEGLIGGPLALLDDSRYVMAIAVLVAAPFAYLGAEYLTLAIANARLSGRMETLSVETQGVRKLRSDAIANLDEIEDYLALEVYPSQFEVLSTSLTLLQNLGVKVPEWTYDVGQLAFSLRTEREIDATYLITAFEKSGMFANVTASRNGQDGMMRMRMDVLPRHTKTAGR